MELEEEEFEVAQLLEDVADLFHTVGMRKGVDVVLDLHDDSVAKSSRVKGDRVKLKQILSNLVSNAVKFTSEGHVAIRAYARKPSSDALFLANANGHGRSNPLKWMCRWFLKKEEAQNDNQTIRAQHGEKRLEFIVEVDDTGKGIPKEKAKSVFENYVQVKETSHGQEGTGLGLGIVQSLVRLMGGEIGIEDKGAGEKGTCFKFNTYLTVCGAGNEEGDHATSNRRSSASHGKSTLFSRPRVESSQVVLFMQSEERLRVAKKTMEHIGIDVSGVSHYEAFLSTLNSIKQKLLIFPNSSSERSDGNSIKPDCLSRAMSRNSSTRSKQVALSMLDGTDQAPQPTKRRTGRTTSFILIVVDTSAGAFRDICSAIAEFRKDLGDIRSRVVWVEKHGASNIHSQGLHDDRSHADDVIIFKPFHGSRLQDVIGTLPEFWEEIPAVNIETINIFSAGNATPEASASRRPMTPMLPTISVEQTPGEIVQIGFPSNTEIPLSGRKILVAEDDMVLRKIATSVITKLGATVDTCVNGQEALDIICNNLTSQRNSGAVGVLPYDFIFMDCEMPVMDGFEATQRIRQEEKQNGVHIPIIAVSAHTDGPELRKMIEAGMDSHLPKPLNPTKLMKVLVDINGG